jgi:hypothetical protein
MALIPITQPTANGVAITPTAVSASDTIAAASLGSRGAYLIVINAGGSPDTVNTSDSSATAAGGSNSTGFGSATAAAATKSYFVSPQAVNPATGVVTVTHSFVTSVTCYLLPIG